MSRTTKPPDPRLLNPAQTRGAGRNPLYRQIESGIEAYIRDEHLEPDDQLPSIISLAKTFNVNGLTVRRALSELSARGVVVSHQGRGTFVAPAALRVVHWVSGVDVFRGDVSPFYTAMLRKTTRRLSGGGETLRVEPAWVAWDPDAEEPATVMPRVDPDAAGYVFCGCLSGHPLLTAVREARLPHVRVAHTDRPTAWTVSTDPAAGAKLAFEHLAVKGLTRVGVIAIENFGRWLEPLAAEYGLTLHRLEVKGTPRSLSAWEASGYSVGRNLATTRPPLDAWYIPDDILARGASRVLLGMPEAERPALVVQTSEQQIVPLGLPTTYITFDLDELAGHAAELLVQQFDHAAGETTRRCRHTLHRAVDGDPDPLSTLSAPSERTPGAFSLSSP